MNRSNAFDGLAEFIAISKRLSFRKAALDLGVTPGAVSQSLQKLEARLGVALLHRTTRKISLTEAGAELLSKVGPAAGAIISGLEDTLQSASEPSGTLRLIVERLALQKVIAPVLVQFREQYPKVHVDITVSNIHSDFTSDGYDAGIRIGSYISQEMIAVRLSAPFPWAVFGSPGYFKRFGKPETPEQLENHECIRFRRQEKGDIYRWEFLVNDELIRIEPKGYLTGNDGVLIRRLASEGLGLMYSSTYHVADELARGALAPALMQFSAGTDGLFLYFAKSNQNQPKLRAFLEICNALKRNGAL